MNSIWMFVSSMLGVLQRTPVFDNISLPEIGRLGPFARGKWCIVSGVFFFSVVCMSTCQKKNNINQKQKSNTRTCMNNILIFLQYWIESIETTLCFFPFWRSPDLSPGQDVAQPEVTHRTEAAILELQQNGVHVTRRFALRLRIPGSWL